MTTANLQTLTRTDYEYPKPAQRQIAVAQEALQPYGVSDRLDLLGVPQPLASDAIISIAESVRNIATLLEMLLATKVPPISGSGSDRDGVNKPHKASAPEHKAAGYGLPCSKCHAYYRADLTTCPICQSPERISPKAAPALAVSQQISLQASRTG